METENNCVSDVLAPRKSIPLLLGETPDQTRANVARTATSPELACYRVIDAAESNSPLNGELDVPALFKELQRQAEAVQNGDMRQAEAMLANQAVALQSVFSQLIARAFSAEQLCVMESYMKLALRAQSQSRATLEALSAIKNPPVVFAQQANIAQGHQQVNNTVDPATRAREKEKAPNQLSTEGGGV